MFRNQKFNVLTFLLTFAVLYYSFIAYIGIISPGGRGYSPFLDHYLNVPAWLTYVICTSAKTLLQVLGYDAYQKAPNNVSIHGARGVNIIWACIGYGVMSFWVAFVAAHKAGWKYKTKWIATGVLSIVAINIIRIASIPLAFYYHWKRYTDIEMHFLFNVVSYIFISALVLLFINRYNKQKSSSIVGINNHIRENLQ